MPFKGTTAAQLGVLLRQGGEKAQRRARERMKKEAEIIMEESKKNAPRDDGDLEAAHEVEKGIDDNRRLQVFVSVGGVVMNTKTGKEHDVDQYAEIMHELYESFTPGTGTLEKRQEYPDRYVGGKYLERALEAREEVIPDELLLEAIMGLEEDF